MNPEALAALLGADPLPWVLDSTEPYARWAVLTGVLGLPADDPQVADAHQQLLADPGVHELLSQLPAWDAGDFPGHHSPLFLPNRLNLLADMGLGANDSPAVGSLLDAMLAHQETSGRFQSLGKTPGRPKPEWGSLLCDTHAITDILLRFGRGDDLRVVRALDRIRADLVTTPQGRAWQCVPDQRTLFRGPGRKADVCPQVTLEGLRAFSHLPGAHPDWLLEAARTPLEIWRRRAEERPYMFGHGYQFKSVKWPNYWYDVLWVLETVGRFPELFVGPAAREADTTAVAELAACLIAYNIGDDGRVIPRRAYRGFEHLSFGQKRDASPFATARVLIALSRLTPLAEKIASIDVEALPGSKGGSGTPVPPPRRLIRLPQPPSACPVPQRVREFDWAAAVPRVLDRHHLQSRWDNATLESLTSDVLAVHAAHPFAPFAAFEARLPGSGPAELERALYERRSLVTYRCIRGNLFVVRTDALPALYAATNQVVVRAARKHAQWRGVDAVAYAALVPRILEITTEKPASTEELRAALRPEVDLAAAVTLMLAEGLLLRDRPVDSRFDRMRRFVALSSAIPNLRLGAMRVADAHVVLVRGYVRAFGPVQIRDIVWWTGMGPKRVNDALATLGDEIVEVMLRDAPSPEPYLIHAADVDELETSRLDPTAVSLLPSMDTFSMGYANRTRFATTEQLRYVYDRSGNATSVIICAGRVVGVWDIATRPAPAVLVHLFAGFSADLREQVQERALALGRLRFEGADVAVTWEERMVPLVDRPHGWAIKPLR